MSRDTYDFILGLRAIRSFEPRPLRDEDLSAILEAARWTGSSKNRQSWSFVVVADPQRLEELAKCGDFTDPIRSSVVTVVIVQEPEGYEFDSGRAAQNMMLAAAAVGVASCPITLHREDDARRTLEVPDGRRTRYAVAFGYPSSSAAPARRGGRRPLAELVHRDRYS